MLGAMDFGIADDSEGAGHQQAAQVAVALLADTAEPLLASARVLLGDEPDPGRESGLTGKPSDRRRWRPERWPATDRHQESHFRRRLVSLDRCHALIIRSNSRICFIIPSSWAPSATRHRTCNLGQPFIIRIGDDSEQLLDALATDRRNNPELGKMGADRIDHRGLLADEQMTGAMERQASFAAPASWSRRIACSVW